MAYSKQNFQNGQILNAANLEAMENGIIAGQGAHNLLDNSDFRNPVNQRGATRYTGIGYTIDRWKGMLANCSTYINANASLAFNTSTEGANAYWRQYLPHAFNQLAGKKYTLAIKDAWGKTFCASGTYPASKPTETKSVVWVSMYTDINIVLYCLADGSAFVQINTKSSIPIEWVALYEGSYTTTTLPAYQPKGYAAELAECMRYYWQYWQNNNMSFGNGYMNTTDTANITFEFPTKMRVAPTISFEDISTLRVMCVDGLKGVTAYSVVKSTYNQMMVGFTLNSASTKFTPCTLRSNSGVKIEFSADL